MEKTCLKTAAWLLAIAMVLPLSVSAAQKSGAQKKKSRSAAPTTLKVGDQAPEFKMQYFDGHDLKDVSLADYRGKKNVVLAFYVFAFTGG